MRYSTEDERDWLVVVVMVVVGLRLSWTHVVAVAEQHTGSDNWIGWPAGRLGSIGCHRGVRRLVGGRSGRFPLGPSDATDRLAVSSASLLCDETHRRHGA